MSATGYVARKQTQDQMETLKEVDSQAPAKALLSQPLKIKKDE